MNLIGPFVLVQVGDCELRDCYSGPTIEGLLEHYRATYWPDYDGFTAYKETVLKEIADPAAAIEKLKETVSREIADLAAAIEKLKEVEEHHFFLTYPTRAYKLPLDEDKYWEPYYLIDLGAK